MSPTLDLLIVLGVLGAAAFVVLRRLVRRGSLDACTSSPGCGGCHASAGSTPIGTEPLVTLGRLRR